MTTALRMKGNSVQHRCTTLLCMVYSQPRLMRQQRKNVPISDLAVHLLLLILVNTALLVLGLSLCWPHLSKNNELVQQTCWSMECHFAIVRTKCIKFLNFAIYCHFVSSFWQLEEVQLLYQEILSELRNLNSRLNHDVYALLYLD